MRLHRRGDIWHYDFAVDGKRYRGSTGFSRKADAEKKAEGERRRRSLGEVHSSPTLHEVARKWFVSRQEKRKSVSTVARRLEIVLRLLGRDTPVNQIGTREIEQAMQARRYELTKHGRPPADSTINRDLIDTVRPILRYAGRVLEEPVKLIAWSDVRLTESKGRSRSFSPAELDAWLAALPEWHRPLLRFILRYGVRLNEAFFPLASLNVEACEITLRERKNGLPHVVTLLPDDARDLAARSSRAQAAGLQTVWFRQMRTGRRQLRPIKPRGFQSASYVALRRAGIEDARPAHDGRHHAATELLRRSGRLELVKELLGHESISSTMRYAHTKRADLHQAMRHAYGTESAETGKFENAGNGLPAQQTGT